MRINFVGKVSKNNRPILLKIYQKCHPEELQATKHLFSAQHKTIYLSTENNDPFTYDFDPFAQNPLSLKVFFVKRGYSVQEGGVGS